MYFNGYPFIFQILEYKYAQLRQVSQHHKRRLGVQRPELRGRRQHGLHGFRIHIQPRTLTPSLFAVCRLWKLPRDNLLC